MTTMTETPMPSIGSRWRLKRDIDRYPHFIAPKGAVGTVTDTYNSCISLKLDFQLAGAEGWDNEVVWAEDAVGRFPEDCERVG